MHRVPGWGNPHVFIDRPESCYTGICFMRLIVVIAGALGFITVLLGSIAWRRPPDVSLVNGILASFVAAILLRWWMRIWITGLEQSSRQEELSIKLYQYEGEIDSRASVTISSESTGPT